MLETILGRADLAGGAAPPSVLRLAAKELAALRARWYLRAATSIGRGVRVWGRPTITNEHGLIMIGDHVRLVSTAATLELAAIEGTLDIGAQTEINSGCSISAHQLVQMGPRCVIGPHCLLMDNDFHGLDPARRREMPPSAPIILQADVWLAARVTVLRGVTIGAGSVIGTGSVVTKDVPPRCLAAGLPARVIRPLS